MKSTSIRSHIRFPSRGAERRASLRPVRRRGVLSKLPGPQPVTKRCSRMRRVGALLQREELLHSGLSARADERNRSQGRKTRHQHGSLSSVSSAAMSMHAKHRNVGQRPFVLLRGHILLQPRVGTARGLTAIRRRGSWPCACTVGRSSEEPTFPRVVLTIVSLRQKSDERRHRRGSAQNRETGAASGSETQSGATPAARSSPGRWKALRIIRHVAAFHGTSRDGGLGRALAGSSSRKRKGGLLSRKRRGQAERGDGSVRG
jgi:hypothetical protein